MKNSFSENLIKHCCKRNALTKLFVRIRVNLSITKILLSLGLKHKQLMDDNSFVILTFSLTHLRVKNYLKRSKCFFLCIIVLNFLIYL